MQQLSHTIKPKLWSNNLQPRQCKSIATKCKVGNAFSLIFKFIEDSAYRLSFSSVVDTYVSKYLLRCNPFQFYRPCSFADIVLLKQKHAIVVTGIAVKI